MNAFLLNVQIVLDIQNQNPKQICSTNGLHILSDSRNPPPNEHAIVHHRLQQTGSVTFTCESQAEYYGHNAFLT